MAASAAAGNAPPCDLGLSLENYGRLLDTAALQGQGMAAVPEWLACVNDPDSPVRFQAVLRLVALQSIQAITGKESHYRGGPAASVRNSH